MKNGGVRENGTVWWCVSERGACPANEAEETMCADAGRWEGCAELGSVTWLDCTHMVPLIYQAQTSYFPSKSSSFF